MKSTITFSRGLALLAAIGAAVSVAAGTAAEATAATASAANKLMGTLSESQRGEVKFGYTDAKQRVNWSNLPEPMYHRKGLRLGDLTAPQREAVMGVMAAALSKQGYQKIVEIMDADETLKEPGNGGPKFGKDDYYFSILGTPSATDPWMIQFGGHHLALNVTLDGKNGVLTPSHTAAQPAKYTLNGKTIRPLGRENDKSFDLINALDEAQKKQAILGSKFHDLVLGPGHDGQTIAPEGVKVSTFTASQKGLLTDLIGEWVGMANDGAAASKMTEIKEHLDETYFAWSGPITPGSPAYFRIQGPTLVIEYAPQNLGGNAVNHIHTIYRDPTNEYGKKFGGF